MLNRIIIMGRLVRDPELRTTQSGISVTSFTLAVDRDFKGQNGEKNTDFIDVVAWRQTAEFVCKYFAKGRMAVAEGRLQIRDWKDREGNSRRSAEIVADNVYFGDSKRDSSPDQNNGYGAPPPAYGAQSYGGGYGSQGYGPQGGYGSQNYGGGGGGGYGPGPGPAGGDGSGFAEIDDQDGDLPF